jgi:hypothetical protein
MARRKTHKRRTHKRRNTYKKRSYKKRSYKKKRVRRTNRKNLSGGDWAGLFSRGPSITPQQKEEQEFRKRQLQGELANNGFRENFSKLKRVHSDSDGLDALGDIYRKGEEVYKSSASLYEEKIYTLQNYETLKKMCGRACKEEKSAPAVAPLPAQPVAPVPAVAPEVALQPAQEAAPAVAPAQEAPAVAPPAAAQVAQEVRTQLGQVQKSLTTLLDQRLNSLEPGLQRLIEPHLSNITRQINIMSKNPLIKPEQAQAFVNNSNKYIGDLLATDNKLNKQIDQLKYMQAGMVKKIQGLETRLSQLQLEQTQARPGSQFTESSINDPFQLLAPVQQQQIPALPALPAAPARVAPAQPAAPAQVAPPPAVSPQASIYDTPGSESYLQPVQPSVAQPVQPAPQQIPAQVAPSSPVSTGFSFITEAPVPAAGSEEFSFITEPPVPAVAPMFAHLPSPAGFGPVAPPQKTSAASRRAAVQADRQRAYAAQLSKMEATSSTTAATPSAVTSAVPPSTTAKSAAHPSASLYGSLLA